MRNIVLTATTIWLATASLDIAAAGEARPAEPTARREVDRFGRFVAQYVALQSCPRSYMEHPNRFDRIVTGVRSLLPEVVGMTIRTRANPWPVQSGERFQGPPLRAMESGGPVVGFTEAGREVLVFWGHCGRIYPEDDTVVELLLDKRRAGGAQPFIAQGRFLAANIAYHVRGQSIYAEIYELIRTAQTSSEDVTVAVLDRTGNPTSAGRPLVDTLALLKEPAWDGPMRKTVNGRPVTLFRTLVEPVRNNRYWTPGEVRVMLAD